MVQHKVEPELEPLVRPPRLHMGRGGTASRLELFFDLAYVLVVFELASTFVDDPTWHGFAVFTGLFVAIWFSWVGFTLYANRFDTDDVLFRIAKLLATLAIAGCAASASEAVGKFAVPFAASYLASRILLLLLYLRAWRHVREARPTIDVYLATTGLSAVAWAVSLGVGGGWRYGLWAIGVLIGAVGPVLATLRKDRVPLHVEHLPERFGLLVILVLGEAVGGAARGVHDAAWAPASIVIGLVGFAVAAGMWWIYFDVAANSSSRELERTDEEDVDTRTEGITADPRHDAYIYGHLPLTFGIPLAGIGIEELVLHPEVEAPSTAGVLLAAGLGVFLLGVCLVIGGTIRSWRAIWPWPLAAIPIVIAGAAVPGPRALFVVIGFAVLTMAIAAHGTLHSRRPETPLAATD